MAKTPLFSPPCSARVFDVNGEFYIFNPDTLKIYSVPKKIFKELNTADNLDYCTKDDLHFSLNEFFPSINSKVYTKNSKTGLYAIICVSDQCNLRCSYCYRRDQRSPQNMTLEDAEKVVEWLIAQDRSIDSSEQQLNLIFFGGEPLLCKNVIQYFLEEISRRVQNYSPRFSISTNGVLLDKNIATLFKKYDVRVQISIDGNRNIQNAHRPHFDGTGTYDTIVNNLQYFNLSNDRVSARATVSKKNIRFFEQIKHLYDIGFKQLSLGFVVDSGGVDYDIQHDDLPTIKAEMDKLYSFFIERLESGEILRINPVYDHFIFLSLRWSQYCCGATKNVFAFNYSGDLFPCQRFVGNKEFLCGSARLGLNKVKLKKLRDNSCFKATENRCNSCWIRNLCGGKCYFLSTTEALLDEAPMRCLLEETLLISAIENYISMRNKNLPLLKILAENPGSSFIEAALDRELAQQISQPDL